MKQIYIIAAATALLFCACHKNERTEAELPSVEVAAPMVDSVTLHKQYPGYIRAMNCVDIVARVNGQLLNQYYKEGDYVTKG